MSIVTYNNRSIADITAVPGAAESLIHIKTLNASSSATLSFVHGSSDVVLDSTYPIYLFKFINIHAATDNKDFMFNGSDDDSSHSYDVIKTTSVFEAYHNEAGDDASVAYQTSEDIAQGTGFQQLGKNLGTDNDQSASGELFLFNLMLLVFNPSSTTFIKHFTASVSSYQHNDYAVISHTAGYFNTTADITALQFKMVSGNIDSGTIKLYGIKDS